MRKFYSPRWVAQDVVIEGNTTLQLPASFWPNNEIWNWHLDWLSFVGTAFLTGAAAPFTTALGGVARRLRFNVGISQQGDINLVNSSGHAMFGPDRSYLVHFNNLNDGAAFRFDRDRPCRLPPDTGILAEVRNDDALGGTNLNHAGLLLMGYEEPEGPGGPRNPVHLGAIGPRNLTPGSAYTMDNADLFNDGEHPAIFTDMILGTHQADENGVQYDTFDRVSWRVNPSSGPLWMPNPGPIKVGCIAPFNRALFDADDEGPRAYVFAPGTVMKPRQRLSVEVQNLSNVRQSIQMCLFGYLEVT